MKSRPPCSYLRKLLWASLALALVQTAESAAALGVAQGPLAFENADIQVVIAEVAKLTGATFLFDPTRVKGKITVLPAGDVAPAQALELLRSVLALHGYVLVPRAEGTWIVPAPQDAGAGFVVRAVRLTYANAEDVAFTLSWVTPPGVRIVPFYPTNSVVISGPAAAVDQILDLIRSR
jgi:type II secretory pathway component GspD/PulD (secretin)